MESRKELAAEKKRCGSHNCTQSVLCTYCDLTGLDEETIKHAGNCFAAGMGNGEGTCGSIVGAGIVYGLAVRDRAKAVKGISRDDLFLVSKVWPSNYGEGQTMKSIDDSLRKLQTDHIDLMLLHQPYCGNRPRLRK